MAETPAVDALVSVDEIDLSQCPAPNIWQPRWLVDCGQDCEVGITIDDHCFVVLVQDWSGTWKPSPWMPWQVARKLGALSETETP